LRVVVGLVALAGAAVIVFFSEVAFAFACGEGEPCEGLSDPMKMRILAWLTLATTVLTVVLAWVRVRTATLAAGAVTAVAFFAWLSLFVYVGEGDL
jgi:hypothetical protein